MGEGKCALGGLNGGRIKGFDERNDAFDFNVAISDHEKHGFLQMERTEEAGGADEAGEDDEGDVAAKPVLDLRLQLREHASLFLTCLESVHDKRRARDGCGE